MATACVAAFDVHAVVTAAIAVLDAVMFARSAAMATLAAVICDTVA